MDELKSREDEKALKKTEAIEQIQEMLVQDHVIESVAQVTSKLNGSLDHEYKPHQVRKVMKQELDMSFKKINMVALHTNSEKNRILR